MFTDDVHSMIENPEARVSHQADDGTRPTCSPQDFARAVGLKDLSLADELYAASGGWIDLARPVAEIAFRTSLPADISSREFADYIATLVTVPRLGLSADDQWVLTGLSYLSMFTKQTAQLALNTIIPKAPFAPGARDPDSILMRLRMSGGLVPTADSAGRELLTVPALLAAALRHSVASSSDVSAVVEKLVGALVDHLENLQAVDVVILSDVLVLARRYELWSVLARLQDSFGLTLFLLAPQAACTAFAGLPAEAVASEVELSFSSAVTESLIAAAKMPITSEGARSIIAGEMRAGRMRDLVVGETDEQEYGAVSGYLSTIRRIAVLSRANRHEEAATLGLSWRAGAVAKRPGLVVGLLTAMALFCSGEVGRALSALKEIEEPARMHHISGDFLVPATIAWTAMVAAASNDHECADLYLSALEALDWGPCIVDELVSPAMHVAVALRALDRLDLNRARAEVETMAAYPKSQALWAYLPYLSRTIGVLAAESESGVIFVNDDVEKYQNDADISRTGKDLLVSSRSMVYIALGQLKWAENEIEGLSPAAYERIVLKARVELVAGRCDSAISLVETWFYHQSLAPRSRADLAAIKSAALLRNGRDTEATKEFLNAVRLSMWVNSLLPLAFVPLGDRVALIDLISENEVWDEMFAVFSGDYVNCGELMDRLRTIGAISVGEVSMPQLSAGETRLLELLSCEHSISQISEELVQASGTVKNRLSALYRKFAVSNRQEVIKRAKSLGYLQPN